MKNRTIIRYLEDQLSEPDRNSETGPFTIKMLEFHLVTSCAFEISLLRFVNNFLTESDGV